MDRYHTHYVGLNNDINRGYYENNPTLFSKIRVTIHTTGAWPNSVHSDNHVTTMLSYHDRVGGVQIDMQSEFDDRRGKLEWKTVPYDLSISAILHVDYYLDHPVSVGTVYAAIRHEWYLHQYLFSGGGSGCHYWNYQLLLNMAAHPLRFHLPADVPAQAWTLFGKWYSRSGVERENVPIRVGTFLSYEQWYQDWYGVVDDEEDDDDE